LSDPFGKGGDEDFQLMNISRVHVHYFMSWIVEKCYSPLSGKTGSFGLRWKQIMIAIL
jgi:hypothetical protein